MHTFFYKAVVISMMTISLSAHANWFGSKEVVTQNTSSAVSQLAALKSQNSAIVNDFEPLGVNQLKNADCTDLAVHTANAKREMKQLLDQADKYDAQNVNSQVVENKKAGFMSGLISVAGLAGKAGAMMSGDPQMIQMANTFGQVTSAFSNTKNAIAQQNNLTATTSVNESDAEYILKRYKKHEADLENIAIYQSAKACH